MSNQGELLRSMRTETSAYGMQLTLPGDRSVFVGRRPGKTGYSLVFMTGALRTQIVLSDEVLLAVIELKAAVDASPEIAAVLAEATTWAIAGEAPEVVS